MQMREGHSKTFKRSKQECVVELVSHRYHYSELSEVISEIPTFFQLTAFEGFHALPKKYNQLS